MNKKHPKIYLEGKAITFYSYKGGVGRTMALVNIACLMAKQRRKVLLIDWDLEAPGLHNFFKNPTKNLSLGVVDLITDLVEYLKSDSNNNEEGYVKFLEENINKYISKIYLDGNNRETIDIIKAGKFDNKYTSKLNNINWINLYHTAPSFFRTFAQFLEKEYNYILIDSRTGLADTSGICTLLMPQILVLVFALNNQNLNGILDIAKQSVYYRFDSNDYRDLKILPLPSRIDNENPTELANWVKGYKQKFEILFREIYFLDECNLENYFNISKIPYKPIYAYGENIPVLMEGFDNDLFISYHYLQFLKLVENSVPIWEILSPEQMDAQRKKANLHFNTAIKYLDIGDNEKAILEFQKTCELDDTNDLAFLRWGDALNNLAKSKNDGTLYDESFEKYRIASELNQENDAIFLNWGNSLFSLAKLKNDESLYNESFEKYRVASELNPENDAIFLNWGNSLFNAAKLERNIKLFHQSVKKYEIASKLSVKNEAQFLNRKNIPAEILNNGVIEIANYLESLERKTSPTNEARIIILGDKGAGKTCIARRLLYPQAPMSTVEESTAGINTTCWRLEQENINVHIWDFAGHTVTHAVHQFFLSERCLYIIVYDGRSKDISRLIYWLDHMKNYGRSSQAMILINQYDHRRPEIPINFLKEKYPIAGVYFFSIKDDADLLSNFRNEVTRHIVNNPSWAKQEIPENYYHVKNELLNLSSKGGKKTGREYITTTEFVEIAEKYKVKDVERLLKHLHSLGVILWFRGVDLFDTVVLNPEWLSNAVYKIINWVNYEKKYSLSLGDFDKIFRNKTNQYPKNMNKFLFKLIVYFELAYELDKDRSLIIPHLLQEDRIALLPEFPLGESLMLRYKAEQPLPSNTISRFIVRHNQEIKKEKQGYLVWRYGVVLENDQGAIALVQEGDRTISMAVKGMDKTNYLSVLRETLNDIFNSYKSQKPELQYRIERFGLFPEEIEEKNPLWLSGVKIYHHTEANIPYYDDPTGALLDLKYIRNLYNITAENFIWRGQKNQILLDQSRHISFDFHHCNIGLQGNLNELAQLLAERGDEEDAKELENAASMLEQAETIEDPEEIKKKGIGNRLKRLVDTLADENFQLHKTVKGIKNGISIAQDIAAGYNSLAQWAGLPQVPGPFLKKD